MHRDVIVTTYRPNDPVSQLIRVEDPNATEISDIVAMRLAYEYAFGEACANNDLIAEYCRIAPAPAIVIGLDAKRRR